MTLNGLLLAICNTAIEEKLVNYAAAGNSIYEMNPLTITDYPYIFVSPTGNHTVRQNFTTYGLTIFFVDRLLNDNTNDINIFSTGVEELKNLIKRIKNLDEVIRIGDDYTINLFTEPEKFSDKCAGCYATVNIMVKNESTCVQ